MMQNQPTVESSDLQAPSKLTEWENEPTPTLLQEDLLIAQPWHDKRVVSIERWLALRDAKHKGKKDSRTKDRKNRSEVQPKLVRRQAEWRYPALSEPFLSSDKLFSVSPVTWEDVKSAQQNELVLNNQFRTKIDTVSFIDSFVRTAVDEGSVAVRLGWSRETRKVQVEVPVWSYIQMTDPEQIELLDAAIRLSQENPQGFSELPEEVQESVRYSLEKQVPVLVQATGTQMVEEEQIIRNQPTLDILRYQNLYLDPNCDGDIDKANFGVISFTTSKAELMRDKRYKNLDRINWSSHSPVHTADHESPSSDDATQFRDDLRKRVVAFEYWGFYDIHKTGQLVPIVATWIGDTMIRMEENPFPDEKIPVVIVPYLPVTHEVTGEPDAELLEDNQAILGAVMRGMIDLMARSANSQTGHAKGALDTLNRSRYDRGEDYEFNPNGDPRNSVYHHTYPEIPNSALTMLQLQNQEAEALTGVKAFSGGLSGEAYGEVAAGIRGMLDAASKREMSILRRLASGMEKIGRKIASMNAVFLSEDEVVQITNEEFITVSREDLKGEYNLKVDISTAEIDAGKAQDLAFLLQTMGNNMDFAITQKILAEIARLKRMPELAHDILQYSPQPDPLDVRLKELEVEMKEIEVEELRSRIQLNQAKARKEAADADGKDLDFLETESGTKHARDIDKQKAQAQGNQTLEITKRILDANPEGKPDKMRDISDALAFQSLAKELT